MSAAKTAIVAFKDLVIEAPSRIAPERDTELLDVVGGEPLNVDCVEGRANFAADLHNRSVRFSPAALLSLWATARAALMIANAVGLARREGRTQLTGSDSTVVEARRFIEVAERLIANPKCEWPTDLPMPKIGAPDDTVEGRQNAVFLGAAGWAMLHEIAHIVLDHESSTTRDILLQQEFDADRWATSWMLEKAIGLQQDFRIMCVAIGVIWLALHDRVQGLGADHPPAAQRMLSAASNFTTESTAAAFQIAGDMIKSLLDPSSDLGLSEDAEDAMYNLLFKLRLT